MSTVSVRLNECETPFKQRIAEVQFTCPICLMETRTVPTPNKVWYSLLTNHDLEVPKAVWCENCGAAHHAVIGSINLLEEE